MQGREGRACISIYSNSSSILRWPAKAEVLIAAVVVVIVVVVFVIATIPEGGGGTVDSEVIVYIDVVHNASIGIGQKPPCRRGGQGWGDCCFCTLIWDIEVQLSVVSGAWNPGGGMGGGGKKGGVGSTQCSMSIK